MLIVLANIENIKTRCIMRNGELIDIKVSIICTIIENTVFIL